MAAFAPSRQQPAPAQQLTPPSSSHGGGASWDFAVPLNNSSATYEQDPSMSEYVTSAHAPRQPHTMQANGFAKPVRSPTWDSQNQGYEDDRSHLAPERVNELHKKPSGDMGAISTDQDSVLEYYKSHTNNKKGSTAVKGRPKKKTSAGGKADPNWNALEHDQNNWIHRDKLKEIEIREMEEAGFRVGRGSRSNSRSHSRTRRSRDRRGSETADLVQGSEERADARRVVSPIPAEDEDVEEEYSHSPTTYQEFAPQNQTTSPRTNNHTGRPSTSRIPLPRTSGIPVPAAVAERDAPLPRSRAGSENWNGDAIAANGARVRSGSIASQFLLDEPEGDRQTTPPYGHTRKISATNGSPPKSPQKSPMKAKVPGKPVPTSGARKTSVKVQPRTRQPSGATPPKRPGSRGGPVSRPNTSHRPEGEAPWLATMYKPDPRLPPDQQIIPTHAKRMQREQWENQGRVASLYDKDFQMLNTDEFPDKRLSQLSQLQPVDLDKARENESWPLQSPAKQPSLEQMDTNVNKSQPQPPSNEQGGYKLTPNIPQSPRAPSPRLAPPIVPAGAPPPKTTRLPEPVEEAKEKKGCGCIVM
ncbi:hypothetical protein CC86DRAFT_353282 [Ophiobolus disseminans]|uniref:Uncharacterized protein n=1 Tax=Ophiobolus disseminans TaxID=1469910 RepID=A0A6A6ZWP0_9PLEO|nr:hypothetical protein CC86DRAFT_353282 [Ophiobolus disseminans]